MYITWEGVWSLCTELIYLGTALPLESLHPPAEDNRAKLWAFWLHRQLTSQQSSWGVKGRQLYKFFFWPAPKCWIYLGNRRLCRCGAGGSTCLPVTPWPVLTSNLGWMVDKRFALVLRPQVLILCFPNCIICHLSLRVSFFKLVWDCPDRKVNPCLSCNSADSLLQVTIPWKLWISRKASYT